MITQPMTQREPVKEEHLDRILTMNGGWAAKQLLDDAVQRYLNGTPQDAQRADIVARRASGTGAIINLARYSQLTGHTFTMVPTADLSKDIEALLPWEFLLNRFPRERESEQWMERLCTHLKCSRCNIENEITRIIAQDSRPTGHTAQMIRDWSWPLLVQLLKLNLSNNDVLLSGPRSIETEVASYTWRHWYRSDDGYPVLIEDSDYCGLTTSRWIIWRLLHDATHLLHIALNLDASEPLLPMQLWTTEAIAMLAEKRLYERLVHNLPIAVTGLDVPFDRHCVIAMLLWGFAERALRIDYDYAVHLDGLPVDDWIRTTQRRTGLGIRSLAFAQEFHGMPGFCAGYIAGIIAIEEQESVQAVMCGMEPLSLKRSKPDDRFSRSSQTDIPAFRPQHAVTIQKVGTRAVHAPLSLVNPFTQEIEKTIADAHISVSLADNQRGIHMSRLQEAVLALDGECWSDLSNAARHLASSARGLQGSTNAEASLEVNSVVRTTTARTGRASAQPVSLMAKTEIIDGRIMNTVGLSIGVITACPCTIAYSRLRLNQEVMTVVGMSEEPVLVTPTFTHSQPGTVSVKVSRTGNPPPYTLLYQAIRATAHLVEAVLKRPDEHYLVEQSHQVPQFCEDLCRSVATALAARLTGDDIIEVTADLDESIHPHRAYAHLFSAAMELWNA